MPYHLQYRRYRLPFRAPVRTAHGPWAEREGLIVRVEDTTGAIGFGEIAPIPDFGTETADAADAALRELSSTVDDVRLASIPGHLPCLRHALAAACVRSAPAPAVNALGVAALLPAGRAALEQVAAKADSGFRVFKWKVGVAEIDEELGLLDDLSAALPTGATLRLDANGAWDRRKAARWLERCADRPVEFVEQPCFAPRTGAAQGPALQDLLLGLAHDFPTRIALDESLVGDGDIERWLGAGWPGVFVLKPSLIADLPAALEKLARAGADVVFSSTLETALGARGALHAAFAWALPERGQKAGDATPVNSGPPRVPRALGFGVYPLFADLRFDGPSAAPFLRWEDVARLDPEAIWNALA